MRKLFNVRGFALPCALAIATCITNANAEIIAPKVVVADYQGVWIGAYNPECEKYSKTFEPDTCTARWEYNDSFANYDQNGESIFASSLSRGKHAVGLKIVLTDKDGTQNLLEDSAWIVDAKSLNSSFNIDGLPLAKGNKEKEISLEQRIEDNFHCIYYEGRMIETPPEIVEKGKIYCNIIWNETPIGFKKKYSNNPTILSGAINTGLLNDDDRVIFNYNIMAKLPYGVDVTVDSASIDANISASEQMQLEIVKPEGGVFRVHQDDKYIVLDINVKQAKEKPIKISVIRKDTHEEIQSFVMLPGHEYEKVNIDPIALEAGSVYEYEVKASYVEFPGVYKVENIYVARVPNTNLITMYSLQAHDDTLDVVVETPDTGNERFIWRTSVQKIQESSPFNNIALLKTNDFQSDVAYGQATHKYSIDKLSVSSGRYVVVTEVLAQKKSGDDDFFVVDKRFSAPFAIVALEKSNNIEENYLVKGRRPMYVVTTISPELAMGGDAYEVLWTSDHEESTNKFGEAMLNSVSNESQEISAEVVYNNYDSERTRKLYVQTYSISSVVLKTPEKVAVNTNTEEASIDIDGEAVNLLDYICMWKIDGEEVGEATSMPMSFSRPGKHLIEVEVKSRTLKDYDAFISTKRVGIVDVFYERKN